jgi:hypothetical protein
VSSWDYVTIANTSAANIATLYFPRTEPDDYSAPSRVPRAPLKPSPASSIQLAPPHHEEPHSHTA